MAVQRERAHALAVQAQHLVVEVAEHAFDLVVAPFNDAQARRFFPQQRQFCRLGGEVFEGEIQASGEGVGVFGGDGSLGFDVVDLGQLGLRLGQAPRPAAVIGDQHQPGGVEIQAPGDVQVVLVRFVQPVEDGGVLRIASGTDAAGRLVQHEVARRSAGLQHFVVDFDATEFSYRCMGIVDGLAVDSHPALHQQQAHLLAIESRQIAEETVDAHGQFRQGSGGWASYAIVWGLARNWAWTWAQRGHRQD